MTYADESEKLCGFKRPHMLHKDIDSRFGVQANFDEDGIRNFSVYTARRMIVV